MKASTNQRAGVTPDVIEAIKSLPLQRQVQHCGVGFSAPVFDFYARCPQCGAEIKLRSLSAVPEIEDVFDAVFEWMLQSGADKIARRRQQTIAEDLGE